MSSTNSENSAQVAIYKILVPILLSALTFILGITGFFAIKWMASIDSRLANLETAAQSSIELRYRVEQLEKSVKVASAIIPMRPFDDPRHTQDKYFVKPDEINFQRKKKSA
jgi:cell division protein FtsB